MIRLREGGFPRLIVVFECRVAAVVRIRLEAQMIVH